MLNMNRNYFAELLLYVFVFILFGSIWFHIVDVRKISAFFFFGYVFAGAASVLYNMNEIDNKRRKIIIYGNDSYLISILVKVLMAFFMGVFYLPIRLLKIFL